MKKFLVIVSGVLLLTSCVTREQADERLARGCAAAVELFLDDGFTIKEIKNKSYSNSEEYGNSYRKVTLSAIESDNWLDIDKEYKCIFAEEYGFLKTTHRASIYQVIVNDKIYGTKDGVIVGDMKDLLKLTETVDNAMLQ